ncbi:hypothetical protein TNCV_2805551 [Trichonephila clavipes]|nr:hypothetical protein TNCV_2805551 [Trichonephila clavipes]
METISLILALCSGIAELPECHYVYQMLEAKVVSNVVLMKNNNSAIACSTEISDIKGVAKRLLDLRFGFNCPELGHAKHPPSYHPYKLQPLRELSLAHASRDYRHLKFLTRKFLLLLWKRIQEWPSEHPLDIDPGGSLHLDGSSRILYNCRIWETDNPHSTPTRFRQQSPKVTVCALLVEWLRPTNKTAAFGAKLIHKRKRRNTVTSRKTDSLGALLRAGGILPSKNDEGHNVTVNGASV